MVERQCEQRGDTTWLWVNTAACCRLCDQGPNEPNQVSASPSLKVGKTISTLQDFSNVSKAEASRRRVTHSSTYYYQSEFPTPHRQVKYFLGTCQNTWLQFSALADTCAISDGKLACFVGYSSLMFTQAYLLSISQQHDGEKIAI